MKLRKLLFVSLLAILFASCGKSTKDIIATGITLDQSTLEISLESSATLVATLQPTGAVGTVTWSSSDPSIAAVTNGVVVALKMGTATIVASSGAFTASCEVTVTPKVIDPNDLPTALKGSDYYLIHIDETSYSFIQDKVIEDMRPDEIDGSKNLYIWDNTFTAGASTGLNYFGQAEGWISLVVGSVGWSGGGYNVGANYEGTIDMTNLFNNPSDYVFHIAFKSAQAASSYLLIFADGTSEAKICVGSSAFVDGGITYQPYTDFARDNEWHSVEIPLSKFNELGLFYNAPFKDKNVFAFLAGGTAGTTLDMDAIFFYKPATK